jgi:hypothetical protein
LRHLTGVRYRLTNATQDSVAQRELEGDDEAAPEIRKYLQLADIAFGSTPQDSGERRRTGTPDSSSSSMKVA